MLWFYRTPPRQASPATPPREGNCLVQIRGHHPVGLRPPPLQGRGTTPSLTFTGGELAGAEPTRPPRQAELDTPPREGNWLVQNPRNHPVRLRPPPLRRRGIADLRRRGIGGCRYPCNHPVGLRPPPLQGNCFVQITRTPPRQASPATPPEEGNWLVQNPRDHPVKRSLTPLQGRRIALCRYEDTTPSGFACHPSRGGELHPVKRCLTPLQGNGIPPRRASPATPPREGNCYCNGPSRKTLMRRRMPIPFMLTMWLASV